MAKFQNNEKEIKERLSDKDIIAEIEADNEKQWLRELAKKQKEFLLPGLSTFERERIAKFVSDRFNEVKSKHQELCDRIQEYDEIHRMERQEVRGSEGKLPNYRTPLSTVALEVMHSNIMNVIFSPADIVNVLPVEEGDVSKVEKLSVFANWSGRNELNIFEQCDRLFHNSEKVGEAPWMMHWVKEYATVTERKMIMNPADPSEPLIDPDTKAPIFQEQEVEKLVYNAPKLEVFSRKDYIQPLNATMDKLPDWEMRKIRLTYDEYLRMELQGKMFEGSIRLITDWGSGDKTDLNKEDYEGDPIPLGKWEKEFVEFYGRMRIVAIKEERNDKEEMEFEELEDEFIIIVNIESQVLCSARKNKFPLKERPLDVDYFIPDDEGRRSGIGIMPFMANLQKSYDALYNQYIYGVIQSNNPIIFEEVTGNMRDTPIKIQNGFRYPTSNPSSMKIFQIPPPDQSINIMLELINHWAQLLFGISDFTSGVESTLDPEASGKKVQIAVAQGNVRMNQIIKRKNKTLQKIFRKWFLLYQDNMPPNKFMRIAGAGQNPFKFNSVTLDDFALKSIPDFEITGNIENSNKGLQAQKALSIYTVLVQNPFFAPQSAQGLQALHSLTKWLIDRLDETGLSRFLPEAPGENIQTPQEENARFMQGDSGEPASGEKHLEHIPVHMELLNDPTVPDVVKEEVGRHIQATVKQMQDDLQQQQVLSQVQNQVGANPQQGQPGQPGGAGGQPGQGVQGAPGQNQGVVPRQPTGVGGFTG